MCDGQALMSSTMCTAQVGVEEELTESPRDISFCSHAILRGDVFDVNDASFDERFHDNPLAAAAPHVRYCASWSAGVLAGRSAGFQPA